MYNTIGYDNFIGNIEKRRLAILACLEIDMRDKTHRNEAPSRAAVL